MEDKLSLKDILKMRREKLSSIQLVGYVGKVLEDQHDLFSIMEEKLGSVMQNINIEQYLVILPGLVPFVAIRADGRREL